MADHFVHLLPRKLTAAHVKNTLLQKFVAKYPQKSALFISSAKHEVLIKPPVIELLAKLPRQTYITLWDLALAGCTMAELADAVSARGEGAGKVFVIHPFWTLDPDKKNTRPLVTMVDDLATGLMQGRRPKTPGGAAPVRLSRQNIEHMREMRQNGATFKQIATSLDSSVSTVSRLLAKQKRGSLPELPIEMVLPTHKKAPKPYSPATDFRPPGHQDAEVVVEMKRFLLSQKSQNTVVSYARALNDFMVWADQRRPVNCGDVSEDLVRAYTVYLQGIERYTDTYIRSRLFPVRSFCTFLVGLGLLPRNPFKLVSLPHFSIDRTVKTDAFSRDEIAAILDKTVEIFESAETRAKADLWQRRYLALALLASTGARVGAICRLTPGDIIRKQDATFLRLTSKGHGHHVVPAGRLGEAVVDKFLLANPQAAALPRTPIVGGEVTAPESMAKSVNQGLAAVLSALKIYRPHLSTHSFRVAFATENHRDDMPIELIQDRLNHASIHQTRAYVKTVDPVDGARWLDHNAPSTMAPVRFGERGEQ